MRAFLIVLGVILLLTIGGLYVFTTFTYSEGNRAGLLVKFSHKGYIFKTYEGDLNVGTVSGTPSGLVKDVWKFSVSDNSVADSIMMMEGKNVRLHYNEKLFVFPWTGDTKYIVDKAETIQ